jgi:predicted transposase/invertase (TIGR01784 family)
LIQNERRPKYEDVLLKCITEFFRDGAAEFFGIHEKLVKPLKTEVIHLKEKRLFADLVFTTEENSMVHFEFQTTNKKSDLFRFYLTDAYLTYTYQMPIKTIIVYTAGIENAPINLDFDALKYQANAFYMTNFDGDAEFAKIKAKMDSGESLTHEDMITIALLPLTRSRLSKLEIIEESVKLGRDITEEASQSKVLGALGLLAEKFVKDNQKLNEIRRAMRMSKIFGLFVEEGRAEGRTQERIDMARRMAEDGMDVRKISKFTGLTIDQLKEILNVMLA